MNKCIITAFCTAAILTNIISSEAAAAEAIILPPDKGITLLDTSGKIYIHMQNKGSIHITADKTEPEGVFRYYNTDITSYTPKTDGSYQMDLSCCEYLLDHGKYASHYTVNISSAMDKNAVYIQDIIVKDPGFEDIESSEYHFYITMKPSYESGYKISSSNEHISDDGILISELYIEFSYSNKGDVTGDGKLDISDSTAALMIYAKQLAGLDASEFSEVQKKAADMDENGIIDISDSTAILTNYAKNIAGLE